MNASVETTIPLLDHDDIIALCREEQECFVDYECVVYTCNPKGESYRKILQAVTQLKHGLTPQVRAAKKDFIIATLHGGNVEVLDDEHSSQKAATIEKTQVEERLMTLLSRCIRLRGSDIHVLVKDGQTLIKARVDGRLIELSAPQSKEYGAELTAYVFTAHSGSEENYSTRVPNAGSFTKEILHENKLRKWDWRSSVLPIDSSNDDSDCTKMVLRLLTPIIDKIPTFEEMGMDPEHVTILGRALVQPQGAVLFSGPTGSGKTTIAMAALSTIDEDRNINTLEDPPEWSLKGVSQTRIDYGKTKKGSTRDFAFYGKTLLRQDPDVIYFGEVRDAKSAAEFTHLSESGHLLLGTTHTSSATGIATKLVEHLKVPGVIASSPDVFSVFSHQRLIRKLCPRCSIPFAEATAIKQQAIRALLGDEVEMVRIKSDDGCRHCVGGEKGRTIVMEVIELTDTDRDFIAKGGALEWKRHLVANGWKGLEHYALKKIKAGICDLHSAAEQVKGLL